MAMKPIIFVLLLAIIWILYIYVDFGNLLEITRFTKPNYKKKQIGCVDTSSNKSDDVTILSTTAIRNSNENNKESGTNTMPDTNNRRHHNKMNLGKESLSQTGSNIITRLEQKQLGKNTQQNNIMPDANGSNTTKKKIKKGNV
ncbi:uncharacterized protein LOC102806567 [Saccoglossus kowalevskii]|uniref:Uncharacterized protein LOC102806567 n=1 Tax=Saccoglossus kowalevskii TaxID=10224 RepID=A0ABM0LUG3_SACKO|nr:PREDICTED: uncharacterized protein LOC102806567 [Saccoglossus kowalevskii]